MANEPPGQTGRAWLDYAVVATADRLVIRPPIRYFVVGGLFLLLTALLPWIMAEGGLVGRGNRAPVAAMGAVGVMFLVALWGRWWALDRTTDSVRYFPRRLCRLAAIRGARVVERRVGKRGLERAWTVELELAGGAQVRFAGFGYFPLGVPQALTLATIIGDWLDVPVTEEPLSPAA